jgi:hypothetical protein
MASAELRAFLSGLAADPERLGAFMRDPDAVLAASDLDEEDKVAVLSGDPAALRARLHDPECPIPFFFLFMMGSPSRPWADAFAQAFAQAFSEAFSEAFSQAFFQAFGQTFPSAFPDANADTGDAGAPADQPGHMLPPCPG